MADGDRTVLGGWVVREDHRLRWNQGVSDPSVKLVVTGELGHARHLLWIAAAKEQARRELDTLLAGFAQKVGVEYTPSQRRHATPTNDRNEATP